MKIPTIQLSENTKESLSIIGMITGVIGGCFLLATFVVIVGTGVNIFDPNYNYCKEMSQIYDVRVLNCLSYIQEHPGSTGHQIIDGVEQERLDYKQELLDHIP